MKKILIAEDNPADRKILESLLTVKGYSVTFALNGLDASEKLIRERYDLLLLDIKMPYVTGIQFLLGFRGSYCMKDIPVIVLSSRQDNDLKYTCKSLGASFTFKKPIIGNKKFLNAVEELLNPDTNKEVSA